MPAGAASRSYGAVEGNEAEDPTAAVDSSFDASDTYYLPGVGSGGRSLTPSQRIRKCLLVAVPLLAAAFIVGGAAFFLLRDFNNLYPGHGGSVERGGPGRVEHASASTTTSSSVSTKSSSAAIGGGASCAEHPLCADAGLLGDCCPTPKGIQLDCC